MGVELEGTLEIDAAHIPAEAFEDWDWSPKAGDMVEVEVVYDYVPYGTEIGGTWDEILPTGFYFDNILLAEGGLLWKQIDLLPFLSKKERDQEAETAETLWQMQKDDF